MKETELKILEINVKDIRKKLLSHGATKTETVNIHALHFDYPDLRLKKNKELLRLRKVGERTELCFKSKSKAGKFRNADEIQSEVDDFESTTELFQRLGFIIRSETKKTRESYQNGKVHFEIDTLPNIPPLLEIEGPSEEEIQKWVEKLGYRMAQTSTMTGGEVTEYYQKKK